MYTSSFIDCVTNIEIDIDVIDTLTSPFRSSTHTISSRSTAEGGY